MKYYVYTLDFSLLVNDEMLHSIVNDIWAALAAIDEKKDFRGQCVMTSTKPDGKHQWSMSIETPYIKEDSYLLGYIDGIFNYFSHSNLVDSSGMMDHD